MKNSKRFVFIKIIFLFTPLLGMTQFQKEIDSIKILLDLSKKSLYVDGNQSLKYARSAESKYKKNYGKEIFGDIHYRIGTVYYLKAEYASALEHFVIANETYLQINDSLGLVTSSTGLGLVEMGIENYESSITYYEQARKYATSDEEKNRCVIDFNIGLNYFYLEEYDKAVHYLQQSIYYSRINNRPDIELMAYVNMANYHLIFKNYDSSYQYLKRIEKKPEHSNLWIETYYKRGLSNYYLAKNNLKDAEEMAEASLLSAKKMNSKWEIADILGTLSEIAFKKNDFKNAYLLKNQQQIYNDSINSENRIRKIKYLLYQKKEAENRQLAKTNKTIQNRLSTAKNIILIVLLLCIFTLSLLFLYRKSLKNKNKFNEELNIKNERIILQNSDLEETLITKTKILSIVSHDMKSPLATIKQILMMYNDGMLTREEQDQLLKKLLIQVESSIEMLNNLVFWAKKQAQGIRVNKISIIPFEILKNVIHYNKVVLDLKDIKILLISKGYETTKAIIDPDQFQIICQNLLGNCIKFSHNSSQIKIKFSENETHLKIHFIDSGVGMTEDKILEILNKNIQLKSEAGTNDEKGSGLGLVLVQSLLELNDGSLEIHSKPSLGSEFVIEILKAF